MLQLSHDCVLRPVNSRRSTAAYTLNKSWNKYLRVQTPQAQHREPSRSAGSRPRPEAVGAVPVHCNVVGSRRVCLAAKQLID